MTTTDATLAPETDVAESLRRAADLLTKAAAQVEARGPVRVPVPDLEPGAELVDLEHVVAGDWVRLHPVEPWGQVVDRREDLVDLHVDLTVVDGQGRRSQITGRHWDRLRRRVGS